MCNFANQSFKFIEASLLQLILMVKEEIRKFETSIILYMYNVLIVIAKYTIRDDSICLFVYLMVFNATFNNILVISWRSILLVEETREPGENHRPVANHRKTLSQNVAHLALIEIRTHNISDNRH